VKDDLLQLLALTLLPFGVVLFFLAFFDLISAIGLGLISVAAILWLIGREISRNRQYNEQRAYERAMATGWSAQEREDLEREDE